MICLAKIGLSPVSITPFVIRAHIRLHRFNVKTGAGVGQSWELLFRSGWLTDSGSTCERESHSKLQYKFLGIGEARVVQKKTSHRFRASGASSYDMDGLLSRATPICVPTTSMQYVRLSRHANVEVLNGCNGCGGVINTRHLKWKCYCSQCCTL